MRGHGPAVADAVASDAAFARARIRSGEHTGPTSGLAAGFAQANLVILPADDALDFMRFCVRNPKPCPLLEVTDTGSPHPSTLARDADLRTDLPRYRVFQDGSLVDEPTDVTTLLARRSGEFPARLLVHVRMGACRRRSAAGASTAGRQRSDVRHEPSLRRRRPVRGAAGGVDETVRAGRHRSRRRDLVSLPGDARRSGAHRRPCGTGHRRSERTRLRRAGDGSRRATCRCSGRAG